MKRKPGVSPEQMAAVLRAARAMIASPDCWRPVGIGGGRKSAVWAIIDASIDAGIEASVPLVYLGAPLGAKSTADLIEWSRHKTHAEALGAFDRALAALDPAEAA